MAKGRFEEVRRLASAAASRCEGLAMEETKKLLVSAIRSLEFAEAKRMKKLNNQEKKILSVNDPKKALVAIEEMIREETEKTVRPDRQETMSRQIFDSP